VTAHRPWTEQIAVPTVRQRRIACELRWLRTTRGWTEEDVAKLLGCEVADYAMIERCERSAPPLTLRLLLAQGYGIQDAEYVEYFYRLAREADRRGWTELPTAQAPDWRHMLRGLHAGASTSCAFDRTPDVSAHADATVDATLRSSVIVGAAAVRVGSDMDAAGRLRRLLDKSRLSTVDIRLLPPSAPEALIYSRSFTMLLYPTGGPAESAAITCVEYSSYTRFLDTPDECAPYLEAFNRLWVASLGARETEAYIEAALARASR
jgi:transcriptional regulator with XRE-family HTH domain